MPSAAITAVDSHAHVFVRGLPLAATRRHAPDYDATLDEYLGLLDAHGVSHGVLVQPSFLGTDNRFLIDALRACPQRLRGVAVVDPGVDDATLQAMAVAGVCGIRLNLVGMPLPDFSLPGWRQLFARVRALDWHVELHRESRDLPLAAQAVLDAGCALVVDHFGRPASAPASSDEGFAWLLDAAACGRVWVKLSAAYRNWPVASEAAAAGDAAQALLKAFGPEVMCARCSGSLASCCTRLRNCSSRSIASLNRAAALSQRIDGFSAPCWSARSLSRRADCDGNTVPSLGLVYCASREFKLPQPVVLQVPASETHKRLDLFTQITVFGKEVLNTYTCSLTMPLAVCELQNQKEGITIKFEYVMSDNPGFTYTI